MKKLWNNALFVFDANTLLNMYRYSRDTVEEYLAALEALKEQNRVWLPYQAGYEFYENRLSVIAKYSNSYDDLLASIEKFTNNIGADYSNHPFMDIKSLKNSVEAQLSDVVKLIESEKRKHPKWDKEDEVLTSLNSIFESAIGSSYSDNELDSIYQEGEERYKSKVPPGYKDASKGGIRQYGDLVLWKSMIDKAKEVKKPIIFVSGDVKEDWWLQQENEKVMPRPELKKEMRDIAGVDFHIYTAYSFIKHYRGGDKKSNKVSDSTLSEVKRISENQERSNNKYSELPEFDKEQNRNTLSLDASSIYELTIAISQIMNYFKETKGLQGAAEDLFLVDMVLTKVISRIDKKQPGSVFYSKKLMSYVGRVKSVSEKALRFLQINDRDDRELKRLINNFDSVIERM